jgi:hypothetical protein
MSEVATNLLRELVAVEPLYDTGSGDSECVYCVGHDPFRKPFAHEESCPRYRAKQVVLREER